MTVLAPCSMPNYIESHEQQQQQQHQQKNQTQNKRKIRQAQLKIIDIHLKRANAEQQQCSVEKNSATTSSHNVIASIQSINIRYILSSSVYVLISLTLIAGNDMLLYSNIYSHSHTHTSQSL